MSEEEKDAREGLIQINPLVELTRTYGYETKNTAQVQKVGKSFTLTLSRDSKVVTLSTIKLPILLSTNCRCLSWPTWTNNPK